MGFASFRFLIEFQYVKPLSIWDNQGMLDRVLNALDRNKPWKIFRHGSSFVNLLKVLGIWPKLVVGFSLVLGIFIPYLTSLPLWAKFALGFGIVFGIPYILLVVTIHRALATTRDLPIRSQAAKSTAISVEA